MNLYAQLDAVLQEITTLWDIPGLGVGIVADGEIVYARDSGCRAWRPACP
jgi:hypothetical protein